jgi:hypothetical protein
MGPYRVMMDMSAIRGPLKLSKGSIYTVLLYSSDRYLHEMAKSPSNDISQNRNYKSEKYWYMKDQKKKKIK